MVRHRRRRCPITPPRRPRCHHRDRCGFRSLHGRRSRKCGAGPISTVLRRQSTGQGRPHGLELSYIEMERSSVRTLQDQQNECHAIVVAFSVERA